MSSKMRNKVQKKFSTRGYKLKMEALTEILGFISQFPETEDEALDLLLDELYHVTYNGPLMKSSILDNKPVQRVVSLLLEAEAAVEECPTTSGHGSAASALRIIDAFDFPKFRYNAIKILFHKYSGKLPIYGDASAKDMLYRDISNSISGWSDWKEMGHGTYISVGGWPFLLGRLNCRCGS